MSNVSDILTTSDASKFQVLANRGLSENLISGRNRLDVVVIRANGQIEVQEPVYNSRTDAGALWQAGIMGNATAAASAQYIALTNTGITIAKGDTTLSGEISTNGLGRAIATYGSYTAPASLSGTASYVLSKTFSATGSQAAQAAGLFNASSGGTLFTEATFTAVSLSSGDSLAITWTITI